jgi:signal transduction histidine kinase
LADNARIAQVVMNLLLNAKNYGPHADTIDVCVSTSGQSVRVEVTDRGPGVPPDEQSWIFARATRGSTGIHGNSTGKGVGLYLAKAIVEAHDGNIGVESVPGQGATFWFTLPAMDTYDSEPINLEERKSL